MIFKTISVTYGRKFNLDDYESLHVEQTLWADLDEGDDPADCQVELWDFAKQSVKCQVMPVLAVRRAKREGKAAEGLEAARLALGGDNGK